MTEISMGTNKDKRLRWCCFECGKVIDDEKTPRYEDVKQGDPLNPLCCGREMRPILGDKRSARIDVIQMSPGGKRPDGTEVSRQYQRPWWMSEWEVWVLWPERPGMDSGDNKLVGYVGLGLAGKWEFLSGGGIEGGGSSKMACVKALTEIYLNGGEELPVVEGGN